ncbi:MAG: hypothetical protein OHK0029_24810 [Armatimonadaceae bacterium]
MRQFNDPVERALAQLDTPEPPADLLDLCLQTIQGGDWERIAEPMPYILAVDDEPNIVRLIQVNLERKGYEVETAQNGVQALAKIRQRRPDLVISDVMMPEMDGFEFLSTLRRDPQYADLSVLMLTAKAAETDIVTGFSWGADMYLTKPFNPQELLLFVQRILNFKDEGDNKVYRL